jgi:rod shape-determining protein MreC
VFVLLIAAVLLLSSPAQPIRQALITTTQPLAKLLYKAGLATSPIREADEQDMASQLRAVQAQVLQLQAENSELRRAADFAASSGLETIGASIIGRSPDASSRMIRIDRGSADGVKQYAAVTTDGFLVGRVMQLEANGSWVQLITDPDFRMTVTVGQAQTAGLAYGSFGGLNVKRIPLTDAVQIGDPVLSSDVGEQAPSGLVVGTVSGVRGADSVFHDIDVATPLQLETLRFVQIVVP